MENLLVWGFYFLTLYAFLPGLVSRLFGFRVFKRGDTEREIALTFDDGPDPVYTPQLLDLLARHGAKATFFVVGSRAEQYPELLQRMRDEGHTIGIHNYVHKTNWLMRPSSVRKQIQRTAEVIEQAAGVKPLFYRPPWGIVNLFDFSRRARYKIVLWSGIFGDWKLHENAERLTKRMLEKLRPGEVILLHDCGVTQGADPEAPGQMLEALAVYLDEGARKGYRFVDIGEMIKLTDRAKASRTSWLGSAFAWAWLQYEKLFHIVFKLKPVQGTGSRPMLHYRLTSYNGPPVQLKEGTISKGDTIAELHLDNALLRDIALRSSSPVALIIHLIREMEHALPIMSRQVLAEDETASVKAIYGVTMIHSGTDRLGFEIFDLPENLFAKASRIYLRILFKVLSAKQPKKKSKRRSSKKRESRQMTPRMIFMPRQEMLRYCGQSLLTALDEAAKDSSRMSSMPSSADETEPVASGGTAAY